MIRITQLKLRPDHTRDDLRRAVIKQLRLKENADFSWEIRRQSIDARKKPDLFYVYTVDVSIAREKEVLARVRHNDCISVCEETLYRFPESGTEALRFRPVIIGSGPAGLFCALMLARAGYQPVVVERGDEADQRAREVERFWNGGALNPNSNVQFGEGGAGTFSDGKLNTAIKDPCGRIRFILSTFVEFGAPKDILCSYKPHIGTDLLRKVIVNMRRAIEAAGGTFLFHTQFTGFYQEDGCASLQLLDVRTGAQSELPAQIMVLAPGHSARDTFSMLYEQQVAMHAKSFAVGVRVQHPQQMVNDAMYGEDCPYELGAAPYKLTAKTGGRGVYSFCMCPGGYVVNASSAEGMTAVNGMSEHARDSENANSAIVVTVDADDLCRLTQNAGGAGRDSQEKQTDPDDPLRGVRFQEQLERNAFEAGRGLIPTQRFDDFRENRATDAFGAVKPVMKGGFAPANIRGIFPEEICRCIEEGILSFDRKIPGFASPDILLSAVESRTSSPVRIERGPDLTSVSHPWIYPCGEGAGYAGGITSAAADGLRVAEAVASKFGIDFLFK